LKHTVFVGHYGTGKTSIAVNYAIDLKRKNGDKKVYLIDLDIVNPYFGSFENADILKENGVDILAPAFAGTNLDAPSLPAAIHRVFAEDCFVVWDMGGDDVGSVAIGRYSGKITEQGYDMYYVVNCYRPLTSDAVAMKEIIDEIEASSRLKINGIVNNSNLGTETEASDVLSSVSVISELEKASGLSTVFVAVSENVYNVSLSSIGKKIFKIKLYTKKYW